MPAKEGWIQNIELVTEWQNASRSMTVKERKVCSEHAWSHTELARRSTWSENTRANYQTH